MSRSEKDIYKAGTVAKIVQMLRLPNGLMKILVEGESQGFDQKAYERRRVPGGRDATVSPLQPFRTTRRCRRCCVSHRSCFRNTSTCTAGCRRRCSSPLKISTIRSQTTLLRCCQPYQQGRVKAAYPGDLRYQGTVSRAHQDPQRRDRGAEARAGDRYEGAGYDPEVAAAVPDPGADPRTADRAGGGGGGFAGTGEDRRGDQRSRACRKRSRRARTRSSRNSARRQ